MGKKLYIMLIFIGIVFTVASQEEPSGFLFREFKDAKIYIASSYTEAKVNYNVMDKQLYYLDTKDRTVKIVDNMMRIQIVKFDNRNFIPVPSGGLQEVLPTTPPIYIEYFPKVKRKGQQVGYGGTSELTSSTSPNYLFGRNGYILPDKQELEVTRVTNCYWIEKNGKKKKFANFKQLVKIYPGNKTVLDEYIKTNNVDFNNAEEIVNLCLYAENLN